MIENFSSMLVVLQPNLLLLSFGGVVIGIIVGILPGMNASMGLAILLPLTYALDPLGAMMLFFGIYAGSNYGGSVTAILINTPGTAQAAATSFDGYPLAKKGEAGRALGMAAIASGTGGLFSILVVIFLSPIVARGVLVFGPAEFAALCFFGISLVVIISGEEVIKGLISALFGILLGVIGMDMIGGVARFTFGSVYLLGGIDFLIVLIGMFAISEVLVNIEFIDKKVEQFKAKVSAKLPSRQDIKSSFTALWTGCIFGTFIGSIPGAGATIASFINYGINQRFSKAGKRFGKGAIEGVASVESSNNAAAGGAMIPLLTLGIPGSSSTAVMLGGLAILGIRPGPFLFVENPELVWGWFGGFVVGTVFFIILGLIAVKYFSLVLYVPRNILFSIITILCLVGAYSLNNRPFDMVVVIIFGFIGYLFKKIKVPIPPLVLALILMPVIEENLRMALMITRGNWTPIFAKPIVLFFVICLLYTSPSPRDRTRSRMPSSA